MSDYPVTFHTRPLDAPRCQWQRGCTKKPTVEVWSSRNDRYGTFCAVHGKRRAEELSR